MRIDSPRKLYLFYSRFSFLSFILQQKEVQIVEIFSPTTHTHTNKISPKNKRRRKIINESKKRGNKNDYNYYY